MQPKAIKKMNGKMLILWKEGELSEISLAKVRKACACAVCRELKIPIDESMPFFPRAVSLNKMDLVGNYAVALSWGDGHRSIYAFESLKEIAA